MKNKKTEYLMWRCRWLSVAMAALFTLHCSLFVSPAGAQPHCVVRTFNIRDGLAANFISALGQSPDGLMWASTWNGLCCFDGYRFNTYRGRFGSDEELTSNRIIQMKPNGQGDVWCVTYDRSLYLYDTHQGRFVSVSNVVSERFNMRLQPRDIFVLPSGHTWVVCAQGLKAALRIDDSRATDVEGVELFWFDNYGLKVDNVLKVEGDSAGREWVLTDGGVIEAKSRMVIPERYDYFSQVGEKIFLASQKGQIAWWKDGMDKPVVLKVAADVSAINSMSVMPGGQQLALATNRGVLLVDAPTGKSELVSVQCPGQPDEEVTQLYVDTQKRLWCFNQTLGVVLVDADGRATHLVAPPAGLFEGVMTGKPLWLQDKFGTVWLVPTGGPFCYYSEKDHVLVPRELRAAGYELTNIPNIWYHCVDSQKNLWLSSMHDISVVNFQYHSLNHIPSLPNEETRSVMVDREGRLWTGNSTGRLMVYDRDDRLLGYVGPDGRMQAEPTKFTNKIYAIYQDRKGRMWVGGKASGLYLIDGPSVRHFMPDTANVYALAHADVYDIDEDDNGHIWVGTYEGGLNLIDEQADGSIRFITINNSFRNYNRQENNKVRRITHDGRGTIFLSTTSGLVTFSSKFSDPADIEFHSTIHIQGDTTSLMAGDVLQTCITRSGRIFVATMGGGIQELDTRDLLRDRIPLHAVPQFNANEGNVLSMIEDADSCLWIVRETIVDRFSLREGTIMPLGPNVLGDHVEFSESKPLFDAEGKRIVLGVMSGYVTFVPRQLPRNSFVPKILFTNLRYQGQEAVLPILNKELITLPGSQRSVTISFAALDYNLNYQLRYAYKLEGLDDEWTYLDGGAHHATFHDLPSGHYRLLVRSTNSDGEWVENETALNIDVEATLWGTLRLFLLLALVAAAVGVGFLMGRKKRS